MSLFAMPSLGADMEKGKLVEWLIKPGDHVSKGDVVAVVETQKGAIEIEIFEAGTVAEVLAEPGQTLPVGAPLARLLSTDEAGVEAVVETTTIERHVKTTVPAAGPEAKPAAFPESFPPSSKPLPSAPARVVASPAARLRAAELGIALDTIAGSGPDDAVLLSDVEHRLQDRSMPVPKPAQDERPHAKPGLDMAEMRRAIAAAMIRSKREIPHYYLSHEIDLETARTWLAATNAALVPDRRLLMGALLARATVRALGKVPELNGRYEGDPYVPSAPVHCGLAVAMRGGGLIAPAILDAQDMDTNAIMEAMRDIVARSRTGRLRNSEITKGTITISSLGETGVDALFGVIYPPQVALVGFGSPRLKPMLRDSTIKPGLAVTVTLAGDHRVSDGRRGAVFLAEIDRLLQEPEHP
ncbi:dihydrolipoamide acetyltransferase family protein [Paracoccus benzoatiresistens]|uniref:Dihydrolipoamide acetyltransferase component of pyruvate dehydrogenase complex n=1 Tax=Paracoccus benzoatiresistens TaxID=2997341 RepID=A0ABT4JAG7_9RHOB|nr:dihydrolipoamide acetyltransferase family protein [Paracoccus sp. EF6]MCZ0964063.1 dihydrolipoamide acetyltransferase family protein [Paracoccus sp. EF6]